jgi:AraC-like DNA-binding protein
MSSSLKQALGRYMDAQGGDDGLYRTPIDGLMLMRASAPAMPHHVIYRPALCVVAQGAKQVMLGETVFDYGEMQALIVNVELPALGKVTRASVEEPYLAFALCFDVGIMREVLQDLPQSPQPSGEPGLGLFVDDLSPPLADCVLRLVRMLETPQAIPVLYPSVMREICFWLLTGPHGGEVSKLALPNSHTQRITDAIYVLRDDFAQPISIERLAAAARMSPSSFHQHFKALTAMTPLQYQKQLRLLEARRLMLNGGASATGAAYQVGYESASQFSREYARMFGAPPRRDVTELKATPARLAADMLPA